MPSWLAGSSQDHCIFLFPFLLLVKGTALQAQPIPLSSILHHWAVFANASILDMCGVYLSVSTICIYVFYKYLYRPMVENWSATSYGLSSHDGICWLRTRPRKAKYTKALKWYSGSGSTSSSASYMSLYPYDIRTQLSGACDDHALAVMQLMSFRLGTALIYHWPIPRCHTRHSTSQVC